LADNPKNNVDIRCLEEGKLEQSGKQVKTQVTVRTGLDQDLTRKIVKLIKDEKLKVQAQIQGDQVRVTGKKRDDLQAVIAVLRAAELDMPLQFDNFKRRPAGANTSAEQLLTLGKETFCKPSVEFYAALTFAPTK